MFKRKLAITIILVMASLRANACGECEYKDGLTGICLPKGGCIVKKVVQPVADTAKGAKELITTGKTGGVLADTVKQAGNAVADLDEWQRTGKCGGDICDTLDKALRDSRDEAQRAKENVEDAGQAIGAFFEAQAQGVGHALSDSEKRFREGKFIDAMWHLATDPIRNTENSAALVAQESSLLAAIGNVAASAYGGPGGAAAYSAWLTYKATGSLDAAIRIGVITAATAYANVEVAKIPNTEANYLLKRAVISGAITGAGVAAAGGDDQAMLDAMLMSAGMVVVQDQYQKITEHTLDDKSLQHSKGPAYCINVTSAVMQGATTPNCVPTEDIYVRDTQGKIQFEDNAGKVPKLKDPKRLMAMLDAKRPHVGLMSSPGDTGMVNTLFGETGPVMTAVSKVPGMNAMGVLHDQVMINAELSGVTGTILNVATIPPAMVVTYIGAGGPVYDIIRRSAIENDRRNDFDYRTSVQSALAVQKGASAPMPESFVSRSYVCTNGVLGRTIAVEHPRSDSGYSCRVLYETEKGFSTPWSAKNDANYCDGRADALAAMLVQQNGWNCGVQ